MIIIVGMHRVQHTPRADRVVIDSWAGILPVLSFSSLLLTYPFAG